MEQLVGGIVHFVNVVLFIFLGVKCGKDGSVDSHMEMGKKLLAAGQLADALSHFHAAVGKCCIPS